MQAAASKQCRLQQLQMHGCGIADSACIQKALLLRAAEALESAKPKKKAKKKKKKAAKGKEEAAGRWLRCVCRLCILKVKFRTSTFESIHICSYQSPQGLALAAVKLLAKEFLCSC